jgi:lysophospholipase L1-like esterase
MARTLPPLPESTILFEGDSLTRFAGKPGIDSWPWSRMTGAASGYPDRVGDWIFCNRPDLRLTCHTGAIGGSVLGDVLERFPTITQAFRPGIVCMTIGSNDASLDVPLATFRAQAEEYCRRLRDLCGGKVLYLGNILPAHGASQQAGQRRLAARPHYQVMAEVVDAQAGLAVDLGRVLVSKGAALATLWDGHTVYHDGGSHFNAVGHEIIAGVVLRALGLMQTPGDPDFPAT